MDRIDVQVEVPALEYDELTKGEGGETSKVIRQRVERARVVQRRRFTGNSTVCNAAMGTAQVRENCCLDREGNRLLRSAVERLSFSARGITRILKVARTIADLEGADAIHHEHVAEAVQYRSLDRGIP